MMSGGERLDGVKLVYVRGRASGFCLERSHSLLSGKQARKENARSINEPDAGVRAKLDSQVKVPVPVFDISRLLHKGCAVQFTPAHSPVPPCSNTTEQSGIGPQITFPRNELTAVIDGLVTPLRRTDGTNLPLSFRNVSNDNWHPLGAA